MATLKERPDNWAAGGIYLRDFRADKSTGYEETPHKKMHRKESPDKKPGCRGNDGKAHVYVWIGARYVPNEWGRYIERTYDKWMYSRQGNPWYSWKPWKTKEEHIAWLEAREIQICAGCYKKTGKKRMKADQSNDTSYYHWY